MSVTDGHHWHSYRLMGVAEHHEYSSKPHRTLKGLRKCQGVGVASFVWILISLELYVWIRTGGKSHKLSRVEGFEYSYA